MVETCLNNFKLTHWVCVRMWIYCCEQRQIATSSNLRGLAW